MGVEMAARENENNANAKFWDDKQTTSSPGLFPTLFFKGKALGTRLTNKEHYGMLWYFLEWSIQISRG